MLKITDLQHKHRTIYTTSLALEHMLYKLVWYQQHPLLVELVHWVKFLYHDLKNKVHIDDVHDYLNPLLFVFVVETVHPTFCSLYVALCR